MKHKQIKIDWDDLEEAFSNPRAETSSSLDVITGHVILDGEGDEGDPLDDDVALAAAGAPVAPPREDPTRLPICPPDTALRIEWMKGYLKQNSADAPDVVAELTAAIDAPNAGQLLSEILNRNPEVRDAWYVYRSDRLHELIAGWLEEHGIEPTEPPPW